MKYYTTLIAILLGLTGCIRSTSNDYRTENSLTELKQDSFKYAIVRYAGKLAKRASFESKFDQRYDDEYRNMASNMQLDKYYENPKDGYTYFQIRRIAPSIHERYVATGGRLKRDDQGKITDYEEIYRTWKMDKSVLEEKTVSFFDDMVKGKDLSPYYTENIGDTEHIEFPDNQTYFNKENRRWEMISSDSSAVK
ncbi:hypothetical protein M8998_15085 [Sphingobacterium sp. lm-10]|uniref:hypothetical protein n=1 Tax=Sphingobacterium sp. lm-10 TaxID=2944904 RepID=UPI00201FFD5B|nr:hypothetical protein [Sphingobacterium sp. lm-10]MCL7989273.1 hypothetical protein [Sphingobacterium sp. lm-10]